MKLSTFLSGAALLGALSMSHVAVAEKEAGTGANPYSDCGIGAALFPSNQVLAVTSNVIWDAGTTAITSATASPETCSGDNAAVAVFILNSYDQLVEEAAQGKGEHIETLLTIMKVDDKKHSAVVGSLRSDLLIDLNDASYTATPKEDKALSFYNSFMSAITKV